MDSCTLEVLCGTLFCLQHRKMRKGLKWYSSDVTDEESWFVMPYLLLSREDAGQREP